jgi:UDP-N-acetylmuramate dehydrogenase
MQDFAARRKEKQPLEYPSAGSFFKRPQGHFAGALIEQSGLKGFSVGGAQVSEKHAGFLINTGDATASDFLALMEKVQETVWRNFQVALQPEVRIVGDEK